MPHHRQGGDDCGAQEQGDTGASKSLEGNWYEVKQNGSTNPKKLLSSSMRSLQIRSVYVIKNRQGLLTLCGVVLSLLPPEGLGSVCHSRPAALSVAPGLWGSWWPQHGSDR